MSLFPEKTSKIINKIILNNLNLETYVRVLDTWNAAGVTSIMRHIVYACRVTSVWNAFICCSEKSDKKHCEGWTPVLIRQFPVQRNNICKQDCSSFTFHQSVQRLSIFLLPFFPLRRTQASHFPLVTGTCPLKLLPTPYPFRGERTEFSTSTVSYLMYPHL